MISIKSAKHLQDYKIRIEFNDGRIGEFDTLIWPNELDIAPEYLYFQAFKDDSRLNGQFKKWGYIG